MNRTIEYWLNHYQTAIPKTWSVITSSNKDFLTIKTILQFNCEMKNLQSPTKDCTILEMISSWSCSGKSTRHINISGHEDAIHHFANLPATALSKESIGCSLAHIDTGSEVITAMINISFKKSDNSYNICTCQFTESKTKLISNTIFRTSESISAQLTCSLKEHKTLLGLDPFLKNNLTLAMDKHLITSELLIFAHCL